MAYKIGDYTFESKEEAQEAQKEVQAISYIMKQIDSNDSKQVLAAYQQMVKKDLFHTRLGIDFLQQLYDQLRSLPEIDASSLPAVPHVKVGGDVQGSAITNNSENVIDSLKVNASKDSSDATQTLLLKYRKRCRLLTIACIAMLLIIVGMFVISATSTNPTILNYEEKIVDKYAGWEQELDQREIELNERERQLNE